VADKVVSVSFLYKTVKALESLYGKKGASVDEVNHLALLLAEVEMAWKMLPNLKKTR
jgi:hypothetical protein